MWELSQARRCHWRAVRLWTAGRFAAAQADGVRAVELFERRQERDSGADPAELVAALLTLAGFHGELASHERAERLYHRAVAVLTGGAQGWAQAPILVEVLIRLGNGQRLRGQYTAAEATLRKVVDRADKDGLEPELLGAAHSALGMVCKDTGRYEEAGRYYATALDLLASAGPGARACLLHNLAGLAHVQGQFAEAEGPARRALALRNQAGDFDSTDVAADTAVLGAVLVGLARYEEAEIVLHSALSLWRRRFGSDHYEVGVSHHNLAVLHHQRDEPDQALHHFHEALRIKVAVLGGGHPEVATILNNLAVLHAEQARISDARRCYAAALSILDHALGTQHPSALRCRDNQRRLPTH